MLKALRRDDPIDFPSAELSTALANDYSRWYFVDSSM